MSSTNHLKLMASRCIILQTGIHSHMHVTKTILQIRLVTCMFLGLTLTCRDGGIISVDRVVDVVVVDVDVAGECDFLSSFIIHMSPNNSRKQRGRINRCLSALLRGNLMNTSQNE